MRSLKVVLVGDTKVGKSCILTRFVHNKFDRNTPATVGAAFLTKVVQAKSGSVRLQLWDTAGQEKFRSLAPMYYRSAAVAVLVYDVTQKASLDAISGWAAEIADRAPPSIKIVVVGNKIDLATERAISSDELRVFAEKVNFPYFETSALTGENIRSMFEECAMLVYTNENRRSRIQSMQEESQHLTEQEEGGRGKRRRCC